MQVLITGASSGFGLETARLFARRGHKVIGAARRADKLLDLKRELGEAFEPLELDLRDRKAVASAFEAIDLDAIDALINNAGLALGLDKAHEADFDDWEAMIETNALGLAFVTRLALPRFVANNRGHIINIGSIAGVYPYAGGNVYGATKAFVRQFSLNLRADLAGTAVRVSLVEPGLCGDTEFSQTRFKGDLKKAAAVYENVEFITPSDIAETIYWIAMLPKHINVNAIELMPVAQSFAGLSVSRTASKTIA
ncbi:MAG: SDR family NAD(P)-dependent oxidoreductase [Helicobacteraceae bacterium]|jgi:NADP-dependent 3-hydroxy acid dehydrogenase YdfG|nr:SDR family NAD(P)-dependent oxidoreductase [Helicobacteraceae bacterium]